MSSPAVEARNLYKVFGKDPREALHLLEQGSTVQEIFSRTGATVAIADASFSIAPGEVFVIMGLSGSGKSTLLRMINRLIEPTRGQVIAGGKDVMALSERDLIQLRRGSMTMVFQSFALLPRQRVWENVAFGLEVAGMGRTERQRRALEVLELVGLQGYGDSYPHQLSGGMQQRVGLARALAPKPSLILMDEAFSALDPLIRSEMQDELLRLQRGSELTVVFISHDLDEAMRIGDKIAILDAGRIVQVGNPSEILAHPKNDFVRSFFRNVDVTKFYRVSDVARLDGIVIGEVDQFDPSQLEAVEQSAVYLRDSDGDYRGLIPRSDLSRLAQGRSATDLLRSEPRLAPDDAIDTVIETVMSHDFGLPVVSANRLVGVLTKEDVLRAVFRRDEHGAP